MQQQEVAVRQSAVDQRVGGSVVDAVVVAARGDQPDAAREQREADGEGEHHDREHADADELGGFSG